jgi:hypothetical protein
MLFHISRPDALTSIKVLPLGRRVGGGDQGDIKKQDLTPGFPFLHIREPYGNCDKIEFLV